MPEYEKRMMDKMSEIEEIIKRTKRMDDLIDYHSLSLFPNVRLSP